MLHYYGHFTDEEIEVKRLNNFFQRYTEPFQSMSHKHIFPFLEMKLLIKNVVQIGRRTVVVNYYKVKLVSGGWVRVGEQRQL